MAARWTDHILGPDTTSNRPAPADAPVGALYMNSTTGNLEYNTGSAWTTYFEPSGGSATALADLTDVDTTTTPPTGGNRLIWNATDSKWEPGGGTAVDAGDVAFTPAGTISSTDVQAAIEELDGSLTHQAEVLVFALGDETTAITTGTKVTFRMPFAMTLTSVRASLTTASSSGNPAFDVKESGTTIFSTALTIDATEKTSTTAATPAVISDTSLADDAEITLIVSTAGTGAAGAKITLIGTRT